jgi:S-adenosylmethionine:tRNA ribosyltransferase-isomerase
MDFLNTKNYTYPLPEERIAQFPLTPRDQSKLLLYNNKEINHTYFYNLPDLLPENSHLFFNDTRVIPARLHFLKDTGAHIEIFLLAPHDPADIAQAMQSHGSCSWKCTIGNLKRWKRGVCLTKKINGLSLEAELSEPDPGIVRFKWTGNFSFAEVIDRAGEIPLPPYLNRKPEDDDRERYQTIYSQHAGAVAAPTAGLHFTDHVMASLQHRGIPYDFLTLHVSAGTFQPIKTEDATKHTMHREQIILRRDILAKLRKRKFNVPVGTTAMRTLESIYWWGVKLMQDEQSPFIIHQEDPYKNLDNSVPVEISLSAVERYMDQNKLSTVSGYSSIYIRPGYSFKMCDALITNFHQPSSTLILLVAAFVGDDWKRIYQEALDGNYRFLSYGDSSLLIPG